jgi:hypothetical protein
MIKGSPRNPAMVLILCMLTCGLYYLYYMYTVTVEVNNYTGRKEQDPVTDVILTVLTCGLWDLYWDYKMGKRMARMTQMAGLPITDNAVLYLVMDLLQVGLINVVMQQDTLNRVWDARPPYYGGNGGYPPPGNYPPPPNTPPYYGR